MDLKRVPGRIDYYCPCRHGPRWESDEMAVLDVDVLVHSNIRGGVDLDVVSRARSASNHNLGLLSLTSADGYRVGCSACVYHVRSTATPFLYWDIRLMIIVFLLYLRHVILRVRGMWLRNTYHKSADQ